MLSCRGPLVSVDLSQGVGNNRAVPEVVTWAGLRVRFISIAESLRRGRATSEARPIFRTPTDIRSVCTEGRLSVLLSGLAKSRVQLVLIYFEVERALRDSEVFGNHRQVAVASSDRRVDGVPLDGVEIPNRRGFR